MESDFSDSDRANTLKDLKLRNDQVKLSIFNLRNSFEMLLYYSSVLYCTSVGGTKGCCNKYCTHANIQAYHTIFVKL